MTNTEMKTLTTDQAHLERLRQHGARVLTADGDTELNSYFVGNVINACIRMGCNAIVYAMRLPEIDEELAIAIHKNGHIDSGSPEMIERVLDR